MTPIMEKELVSILYELKQNKVPALVTYTKIKKLFEESCQACLKPVQPPKKTCSKECISQLRSINSSKNVKAGKVTTDRGLNY